MLWVFQREISNFFEQNNNVVALPDKLPLNIDELIAKVEKNTNGNVFIVHTQNNKNCTNYSMIVKKEDNTNNETERKFHNEFHAINPYTGETLINHPNPTSKIFHNIIILHRTLFLPRPYGRIIVGSATLIFVIVTLSGFCLWLPANFHNKKMWLNGFLIRFRKGKNYLFFDLHKTLGFYALIPMLVMALTGLTWSFEWCHNVAQIVFNPQYSPEQPIKSPPKNPNSKRLPYEFFIKKADELIEHKNFRTLFLPEHEDSPVIIREKRLGIFELSMWDKIQFDQYTGEVLQFDRFDDLSIGTKLVSSFHQIHTGEFFGLPTKIIYFLACLITTTLPITGTIIWLRKLRHLRKTKNKTNDKLNAA
jgi:uncharacterized iron-regulated membrane protein